MRRRTKHAVEAGRRLAALRLRDDLTQQAAATKLRVGYRTYQAWEAGDSLPRRHNREKLAELYDVDPGYFLDSEPASSGQLDRIESELIRQGALLDGLVDAIESRWRIDVAAGAMRSLREDPGRVRAAGRQDRG